MGTEKERNYGSMEASHCKRNFDRDQRRDSKCILEKPDGGWGWLVVLGVALSNMTTQSMISVFGLLFMRKLPELGLDTKGISLMVSIQMAILNLSGLATGPILKKFTPRQVASSGGVLFVCGLFLTGYASSLPAFICTYSVMTGLGIGFLYPSTFVAINSYFSKWRGRAVGLSVTGTSVGQMLLPLLVRFLLDEYDFYGTILILSALSCHSLVGAALYQPVEWHMKRKRIPEEEEGMWGDDGTQSGKNDLDYGHLTGVTRQEKTSGPFRKMLKAMDLDLLKDLSFLNLITGQGAVYTANALFQMLLPFFLESVGYHRKNIAICLSVMSGADFVGRLIVPTVTDVLRLRRKTVFFLGAGLSAIARSGLVWYSKEMGLFYPTLALAAICGIVRSAIICNFNLAVSDQTTPEKLPSALGLHMVFKGLSVILFGPLIGFIRDYNSSYSLCMHIISAFFLGLPFLMWLAEFIAFKRTRSNDENKLWDLSKVSVPLETDDENYREEYKKSWLESPDSPSKSARRENATDSS